MLTAHDFYASDIAHPSEIAQVKPPALHPDRMVLVGYAAGPMRFGTSLALTGAYVLAGELGGSDDVDAGLCAYEERMKPLIADAHRIPLLVGIIFAPQMRWGIAVRNRIDALVARSEIAEFAQRYFANALKGRGRFAVPEDNRVSSERWSII